MHDLIIWIALIWIASAVVTYVIVSIQEKNFSIPPLAGLLMITSLGPIAWIVLLIIHLLEAKKERENKRHKEYLRRLSEEKEQRSKQLHEQLERERQERKLREQEEFMRSERYCVCSCNSRFLLPISLHKCPSCHKAELSHVLAHKGEGFFANWTFDSFKADIKSKIDSCDFIGVGNLVLEALMRPNQHKSPDESTKFLINLIPDVVGKKFKIPPASTYARVHTDRYLSPHLRGKWEFDVFYQMCVFAYVLGATWEVLPPPHTGLHDYFVNMKQKQVDVIKSFLAELPPPPPPLPLPPQRLRASEL